MWHRAALVPDHSMAVSVVPIPPIEGSAATMSCRMLFALVTASASASSNPLAGWRVLGGVGQDRDGYGARGLTRGVAAHAVGDRQQARARVRRVLVPLAEETDV